MPDESYFSGADAAWGDHEDEARAAFETKAAKYVANAYGINTSTLQRSLRERRGPKASIHFEDLTEEADIPVTFAIGRMKRLHELAMSDLFKAFHKTPPIRAFLELRDDHGPDTPLVMVFRWPAVCEFMCAHAQGASRGDDLKLPGPRGGKHVESRSIHIRVIGNVDGVDITIEPLTSFLASVI